jgi:hypothetical protein
MAERPSTWLLGAENNGSGGFFECKHCKVYAKSAKEGGKRRGKRKKKEKKGGKREDERGL